MKTSPWQLTSSALLLALATLMPTGCDRSPVVEKDPKDRAADAPAGTTGDDATGGQAAGVAAPDASSADPFALPDGDADELLTFISNIQRMKPQVRNRAEFMQHLAKVSAVTIEASDKVLAGEADDGQLAQAARSKLDALRQLYFLGSPEALDEAGAVLEDLQAKATADHPMLADVLRRNRLLQTAIGWEDLDDAQRDGYQERVSDYLDEAEVDLSLARFGQELASSLESAGQNELAAETYRSLAGRLEGSSDEEIAAFAPKVAGMARRLTLMGSTMDVHGTLLDGDPIDWEAYRGKVVLVDFWATWCGPCIHEIPNVKQQFAAYHDEGFEVLGISLDEQRESVEQFLADREIPWPTLYSEDPDAQGWNHPMAVHYGVNGIPTAILVDQQGKVVSTNARGPYLAEELEKLLGPPGGSPLDLPGSGEEGGAQPGLPNVGRPPEPPVETASGKGSPAKAADSDAARVAAAPVKTTTDAATGKSAPDDTTPDDTTADDDTPGALANPYLARSDLTTEELRELVSRMRRRPLSVRLRPGFEEALVDATGRLLAAAPGDDATESLVMLARLELWHDMAVDGNEEADKKLAELAAEKAKASQEKLAKAARFYLLEREALDTEGASPEKTAALLDRLYERLADERLDRPHLRIASASVRLINGLPGDETADKQYERFGKLFATSMHLRLKRYGQRVAKGAKPSSWVGKPMELAGTTLEGEDFDWTAYRGKVVLVDFWATWCGPCVAMLPQLAELNENYQDRGFEVVGVSIDEDVDALEEFVADQGLPWTQVVDTLTENENAERYNVHTIPSTFLIDAEGKIVATNLRGQALADRIEGLLDGEPDAKPDKDAEPAE